MKIRSKLRVSAGEEPPRRLWRSTCAPVSFRRVEVGVDRPARLRVGLDEHRAGCAAGERLDAHRARARVEVEHDGALDPGRDEVEDVLTDLGPRSAFVVSLRRRRDRGMPRREPAMTLTGRAGGGRHPLRRRSRRRSRPRAARGGRGRRPGRPTSTSPRCRRRSRLRAAATGSGRSPGRRPRGRRFRSSPGRSPIGGRPARPPTSAYVLLRSERCGASGQPTSKRPEWTVLVAAPAAASSSR